MLLNEGLSRACSPSTEKEQEPKLTCEYCGWVDFAYTFKGSKRFCSVVCAKRQVTEDVALSFTARPPADVTFNNAPSWTGTTWAVLRESAFSIRRGRNRQAAGVESLRAAPPSRPRSGYRT